MLAGISAVRWALGRLGYSCTEGSGPDDTFESPTSTTMHTAILSIFAERGVPSGGFLAYETRPGDTEIALGDAIGFADFCDLVASYCTYGSYAHVESCQQAFKTSR